MNDEPRYKECPKCGSKNIRHDAECMEYVFVYSDGRIVTKERTELEYDGGQCLDCPEEWEQDDVGEEFCHACGRNLYEPTKAGCCPACRSIKELNTGS